MIPTFLRPEVFPYASIEVIPAPTKVVCSWCNVVMAEGALPASHGICPSCSAKALGEAPPVSTVERTIEEAQRRAWHRFLVNPATGPKLDALLADHTLVDMQNCISDAAIEAERDEDRGDEDRGSQCGAACGYCGGCS